MATEEELIALIADLKSHLDFCGWGDAYERSCPQVAELQARVDSVLPPDPVPVSRPFFYTEFDMVPPVNCPHCETPFRRLHDMQQHIRDKHGILVTVGVLAAQLGMPMKENED